MRKTVPALLLALAVMLLLPVAVSAQTVTKAEDLQTAVNDAANGETIELGADITLTQPLEIPSGKNIILDLGGHTLSVEGEQNGINNYGTLTVTGGAVVSGRNGIYTEGNLTVSCDITAAQTAVYISEYAGSTTVEGGTITGDSNAVYVDWFSAGTLILENGTFDGNISFNADSETDFEIRGGTYKDAVLIDGYEASGTIAGGTFEKGVQVTTQNSLELTVSGGTFYGEEGSDAAFINNNGVITVTGGDFYAQDAGNGFVNKTNKKVDIQDGNFYGGNGTAVSGNGIMISAGNFTGQGVRDAVIQGGTFGDPDNLSGSPFTLAGTEVSGGTFDNGNSGIALEGNAKITGGTFVNVVEVNSDEDDKIPVITGGKFDEASDPVIAQAVKIGYQLKDGEIVEAGTVKVTLGCTPSGSGTVRLISPNSYGEVTIGSDVTAEAVPNAGNLFDGWYIDGKKKSDTQTYTVTGISEDMTLEARFRASDEVSEWYAQAENKDIIEIGSAEDMFLFAQSVNVLGKDFAGKEIRLTTDLDFEGQVYVPAGNADTPFNGTFDGQGHTLSNIDAQAYYCGAVGRAGSSAVIKNVTVENSSFTSRGGQEPSAGAIAGWTESGAKISDCQVEKCEVISDKFSGGVIGHGWKIDVENCQVTDVVLRGFKTGGIVGYYGASDVSEIKNVTVSGLTVSELDNAGGLIGHANGSSVISDVKVDAGNIPLISTSYAGQKEITLQGEETNVKASQVIPAGGDNLTLNITAGYYDLEEIINPAASEGVAVTGGSFTIDPSAYTTDGEAVVCVYEDGKPVYHVEEETFDTMEDTQSGETVIVMQAGNSPLTVQHGVIINNQTGTDITVNNRVILKGAVMAMHDLEALPEKAPTCTDRGNIACLYCKYEGCGKYFEDADGLIELKESDVIKAPSGHDWDEGKVTKQPGPGVEGERKFTCQNCGLERFEKIPALSESGNVQKPGSGTGAGQSSVKTGDTRETIFWGISAVTACVIIFAAATVITGKRRQKNKK